MIKENQRLFNGLNIVSDLILIWAVMLPAYWIRWALNGWEPLAYSFGFYLEIGLLVSICNVAFFQMRGLYRSQRSDGLRGELWKLFQMQALSAATLMAVLFFFRYVHFSRLLLALFFGGSVVLISAKRVALRMLLRHWRKQGRNLKHILVIGSGETAQRYLESIRRAPQLGYYASAYLGPKNEAFEPVHCGSYERLSQVLQDTAFDEAVVALEPREYHRLHKTVQKCESSGIKFSIIPFCHAYLTQSPQIEIIEGLPLINIRKVPLEYVGNAILKRGFDVVVSLVMLLLLSPLMAVTALCVKLSSPGPILFRQERVGLNRKPFYMLKFRSMRQNDDQQTGWSTQVDDRRTKVGSFIRKCSIDELPQLWNVLRGDMSLIGPRPELPHFVEQFREDIPLYMVKHQIRPGITGWAQVNGLRGDSSISDRIDHDLYYIEQWTFGLDIKILVKTACLGFLNNEQVRDVKEETETTE